MKKIFLETERLRLEFADLKYFEDILALRSDPDIQKYITQGIQTEEGIQKFFDTVIPYQAKHGHGMCSVFLKDNGIFIGQAGLFHIGYYDLQPEIEVGYRFHKQYWGKGYATEVVKALIHWGFKNLSINEIIAFVQSPNKASHRVLEKCGMHNLGLVNCYYGELEKYEITRQEWIKNEGGLSRP